MSVQISETIHKSIEVLSSLAQNDMIKQTITSIIQSMVDAIKNGNKILLCGNGGSAADAQHIAAELSGRFYLNRKPLPAEALHVNTSYITAVANDYSYDEIYSRYIDGMGKEGDVLIGLSTSGNSENVIRAFMVAKERKLITVALTCKTGGKLKQYADYLICVPSEDTPRVQEAHILVGHIICDNVEKMLFAD